MGSVAEWLPQHLAATYGVDVVGVAPLEPWGPEGAQRVDLADGSSWVARPHGPARPVSEVRGDAEILRFLEDHDFPAERLAHTAPVSTFESTSVIVTQLLPGENCRFDSSAETTRGIGDLLGRLHSLPSADGAVTRPAGGWHHLSQAGGGPDEDVRILLPLLTQATGHLPDIEKAACKELIGELESIELAVDLPHCLINVDFGGPNIIKSGGELTAIDWTGSGRGPRVLSLIALRRGERDPSLVDAFVAGYREHARLELDELDRLAGALAVFGLILNAWGVAFRGAMPSTVLQSLAEDRAAATRIAERTRRAFA